MDSFFGTVITPSSALSSPLIMRKSVVLPAPFGPTSPAFSPGLSWKEASTKTTWRPYCLLTSENAIMECSGTVGGGRIFVGSWLLAVGRGALVRRMCNADHRETDAHR